MENYWFVFIVSLSACAILKSLLNLPFSSSSSNKDEVPSLPPGPSTFPVINNLQWIRKSFAEIESAVRALKIRYGPIFSLRFTPRPTIFVGSHSLAHHALVQNGALFSDRPETLPTGRIFNSNHHDISSAAYGPTWRLLRRNLTSEILHPSRFKSYSKARQWVLGILVRRLQNHAAGGALQVIDDFRYATFCLLSLMCFGDKLKESQIQEVERVLRKVLLSFDRFTILNFFPKLLFRKRWEELMQLRQEQVNVLLPLIRARVEAKRLGQQRPDGDEEVVAYVDTLLGLQLPDEKRELNEDEMVSLCSEFLNAGTDTTTTALQWIMANLVKYPAIQEKLYQDIVAVMGPPPPLSKELDTEVKEDDLLKIPYLKAVVLEGLRRHPPGHFVLPHTVTEDVMLGGYMVPKNSVVSFMIADMGWDPEVWENPMEFRPERFLEGTKTTMSGNGGIGDGNESQMLDITGRKEIKMMPFGAGRRICPANGLAMLHLEYLVANLIWVFEWKAVEGDDVDLSETHEFTVVMKNPLRASLSPRVQST